MNRAAQRHADRAWLLMEQGRFEKALSEWAEALRFNPENDTIHFNVAICLFKNGQPTEASQQVADHNWHELATYPGLFNLRAWLELTKNNPKQARKIVEEGIRLTAGQDANLLATLARIDMVQEHYKKAWNTLLTGLRLDPLHQEILQLQLQLLPRINPRSVGWRDVVERTLQTDPANPNFHAAAGWLCWHKNQYNEARTYFRNALQLAPNYEWAAKGYGETLKAELLTYRIYERLVRPLRYGVSAMVPTSGVISTQLFKGAHETIAVRNAMLWLIALLFVLALIPVAFDYWLSRHPMGRYVFTPDQRRRQFETHLMLLGALLLLAGLFYTDVYGWFD